MTTLLHIDSSLFGENGVSARLSAKYVARLRERDPQLQVIHRDLGTEPLPHLTLANVNALMTPAEQRTDEQKALVAQSDQLIAELQQADHLVLGVPMYNFAIPSTLKSWFDSIARAGVTFRYTENGSEGLIKGTDAVIFASRGGIYTNQPHDIHSEYLRMILGFIGITDVRFVYAEGLALGEESRRNSIEQATAETLQLADTQ